MPVYPVGFSIHESKLCSEIPAKSKLLAHIIPGKRETYIYSNEKDYYADYARSWFGMTSCKAGWDCMRHYEILVNGCIPYFIDIDKCPPNTMTHLPKALLCDAKNLYESIRMRGGTLTEGDITTCTSYIHTLMEHTRTYLTNRAMASYILEKSGHSDAKRILFLSGSTRPDYLRCTSLAGFKQLLGPLCHDYPKVPHIYTDFPDVSQLYGKGISYTRVVPPSERNAEYDATVEADIRSHSYDIVIYGSYHRGMPFWDLVTKHYAASDIILLCGEDIHKCNYTTLSDKYHVFVREL